MLKLSYSRPITPETLPALEASLLGLKAQIKRRRARSALCGVICFLLHTALMSLSAVSLFFHRAGSAYLALLPRIPLLAEADAALFRELPERLGLQPSLAQLPGIAAAILLPPLVCLLVTLPLRLLSRPRGKSPLGEGASAQELLDFLKEEAETLGKAGRRGRKVNWTVYSALLSMIILVNIAGWGLYQVRPELNGARILIGVFLVLAAFAALLLAAAATDGLTSLLCGLSTRWSGDELSEDLRACESYMAFKE